MTKLKAHFKSVQPDLGGSLPGNLIFGIPGKDGFSPIAKVTQTDDGAVITITDKNGTTEAVVKNGSVTDKQLAEAVGNYAKQNLSLGFGDDGKLYIMVAGIAVGNGVEINGTVTPSEGVAVFVADFSGSSPSAAQFYSWEGRDYDNGIYDALSNIQCDNGVAKLTSIYSTDKSRWIKQIMTTGGLFESDNFICKFRAKFCGLAGSWNNVITYGTGTHWTNGVYSDGVKWPAGGEIDAFEQAGGYSETPDSMDTPTAHWGSGTNSGYPDTHLWKNTNRVSFTTDEWHDFKFSLNNGYVKVWIDDTLVGENDFSECVVSNNYLADYKPFLKPQAFYIDGSCVSSSANAHTDYEYTFEVSDFAVYQDANVECTGLEIYPQMWERGTELIFPVGAELYLDRVYTPANVSNKACTWVSSNPAVATVVQGFVKVLATGTTTITATCGNATAQYVLTAAATANIPCVKVTDGGALSGTVGDTIDIAKYLKLYPSFTTDEIVITANNSNVTINGTAVTLATDGDTILTVTVGTATTSVPLTIEGSATELMIEWDYIVDGAVQANPQTYISFVADNTYTLHYHIAENPKYSGEVSFDLSTRMLNRSGENRLPSIIYKTNGTADITVGSAYACYNYTPALGDWITIVFTATEGNNAKVYINGELVKDSVTTQTGYMYIGQELRPIQSIERTTQPQYCTGRIEIYRGDTHDLHKS